MHYKIIRLEEAAALPAGDYKAYNDEKRKATETLNNAIEASHEEENMWQAILKSLFQDYEDMNDKAMKELSKVKRTPEITILGSSNVKLKDIKGSSVPLSPIDGNSVDDFFDTDMRISNESYLNLMTHYTSITSYIGLDWM